MTAELFIQNIQALCGGKYTPPMTVEVYRLVEGLGMQWRKSLYRYVVKVYDTSYNKPPDVAKLSGYLKELHADYPELSADSYNRQAVAEITDGEEIDGSRILKALVSALNSGRDPKSDPEVKSAFAEHGYRL
jgi:hypothetical protein